MKSARLVGIIATVVIIGIQFVRPDRTNPAATHPFTIGDPQVESILRRSCFDCHSNETRWPWYSEVAPISWQIVEHVNDGRKHVNFSNWNEAKAAKRLGEICDEVRDGEMPLWNYLLLHQDARLSAIETDTLCTWADARLGALGAAGPTTAETPSGESEH